MGTMKEFEKAQRNEEMAKAWEAWGVTYRTRFILLVLLGLILAAVMVFKYFMDSRRSVVERYPLPASGSSAVN
jgi:flagellar biogenesis protein FliO